MSSNRAKRNYSRTVPSPIYSIFQELIFRQTEVKHETKASSKYDLSGLEPDDDIGFVSEPVTKNVAPIPTENAVFTASAHSIQGFRTYMEDYCVVKDDGSLRLYAVLDGHGGFKVSRYAQERLVDAVVAALEEEERMSYESASSSTVENYANALQNALGTIDDEVQQVRQWSFQGTTAVVCQLLTINNTKLLLTANIGDSRAVLSRHGFAHSLSRDHKPNDPEERERIEGVGGSVVYQDFGGMDGGVYRVNGVLALSRAIGDRSERPAVVADPELTIVEVKDSSTEGNATPCFDEFVVIASDGLWDVLSNQHVVDWVHLMLQKVDREQSLQQRSDTIACGLVEEALRRGSYDNISVVIVWIQPKLLE